MQLDSFVHTALPGRVVFGPGSRRRAADELAQLEAKRVLLLHAPEEEAYAAEISEQLGERFAGSCNRVVQHVPEECAEAARSAATEAGADAVKFQTIVPERLVRVTQTARVEQLGRYALSMAQFGELAGFTESMQPEYHGRDLLIFAEALDLDKAQKDILKSLFEDYQTSFDAGLTELVSVEYVGGASPGWQAWSERPAAVPIPLSGAAETASIAPLSHCGVAANVPWLPAPELSRAVDPVPSSRAQ